jgi:hypothetical protein
MSTTATKPIRSADEASIVALVSAVSIKFIPSESPVRSASSSAAAGCPPAQALLSLGRAPGKLFHRGI